MLARVLSAGWLWVLAPVGVAGQSATNHVAMGEAAVQSHDPSTGLAHFEAALALDSADYHANWRASIALLDQGEQIPDSIDSPERDSLYARAESLARRAVRSDSLRPEGHFALAAAVGRASLGMGKKERIRRASIIRDEALRTIELDPKHDGAYHILGRWNAEIMRLSGFSRFFAKSFLGAGIFRQASWNGAIANLEKAVTLDPGRLYHRLELATVYARRKRYQDARHQLDRLAKLPNRELMDPMYRERAAALARQIADKK